jgi:hypothetical protein
VPVDIHGKTYWTVAERLKLANGDDGKGIKSVATDLKQVGNLTVATAEVVFNDGRRFTGMAMLNYDARSPAERNAPLETAETSAVGRALAFGGFFGSPEGIAGAEEIQAAQEREAQRVIQPQPTKFFADESSPVTRMASGGGSGAAPRPAGGPGAGGVAGGASPAQVRFATKLWGDAGRPMPPPNFTTMNGPTISRLIDELKAEAAS